MTYLKRAKSGGVEVTSAALTLSGLEEQEFLEAQTLNGAVVLFSADAERHELAGIVSELVRLAEAIIADVLDEEESKRELDTVPFPKAILESAGLNGDEYHVYSDNGIVIIVGKNQSLSLAPEAREQLHKHGVTTESFESAIKQAQNIEGNDEDCNAQNHAQLAFDTLATLEVLKKVLAGKDEAFDA